MTTGHGERAQATRLVVVTTNAADSAAVAAWLAPQVPAADVATAVGFYAGVAAIDAGRRAVVLDVGAPDGQDGWRLAELRERRTATGSPEVTYLVVADATHLPQLSGALGTDLAVTSVDRLPPLREVLVTDVPVTDVLAIDEASLDDVAADDQTNWRRTMR
jgi:hypothetical protein